MLVGGPSLVLKSNIKDRKKEKAKRYEDGEMRHEYTWLPGERAANLQESGVCASVCPFRTGGGDTGLLPTAQFSASTVSKSGVTARGPGRNRADCTSFRNGLPQPQPSLSSMAGEPNLSKKIVIKLPGPKLGSQVGWGSRTDQTRAFGR